MAIRSRIETLMRQELTSRAAQRMQKAGDTWKEQLMGFFFPKNEDTVDLCALAVLDRALAEDGTTIPQSARKHLRELASTAMAAKALVSIIFLATVPPVAE